MKATFDILDEICRRAKTRSAIENRRQRSVVMELFETWLLTQSLSRTTDLNPSEPATNQIIRRLIEPFLRPSQVS